MSNKWIGVMGYPLKQSLSKQIQEEKIKSHSLPWKFRVLEWELEGFEKNIRELKKDSSCVGFSITMPYKEKIISYLEDCEEFALNVRSVNCVKNINGKWKGFNTDAPGFLVGFKLWNPIPSKSVKILIVGAGATGRTLSLALAQEGYRDFTFTNRTLERAKKWAADFEKLVSAGEIEKGVGQKVSVMEWGVDQVMSNVFVVNTTPGYGQARRISPLLSHPAWIFDAIYNPAHSSLLKECRQKCFYTMNGWPMFQHQATRSFNLWIS